MTLEQKQIQQSFFEQRMIHESGTNQAGRGAECTTISPNSVLFIYLACLGCTIMGVGDWGVKMCPQSGLFTQHLLPNANAYTTTTNLSSPCEM